MKKFLPAVLCVFLSVTCLFSGAAAYEFPNAFWKINSAYTNAVNSGDLQGITEFGMQAVNLIKNEPENSDTTNVLASRLYKIGESYALMGKYGESADAFEAYIPYGERLGWTDGVKIAAAKARQYTPQLKVFTDSDSAPYFGAKNEPESGILYGSCADGKIRENLNGESMFLLYHELTDSTTELERKYLNEAMEKGIAVEFALNCPNEGDDIRSIFSKEAKLAEVSAMLSEFPSVPVYLRVAAEFDVWQNLCTPEEYQSAFKYVSEYFKSRNSNAAIVFSVNQVSDQSININYYYPGDEYVDWVGISAYSQKYFQGNSNITDDFTEVVFKTGKNSDPVLALKDIIETYGTRKPIMISESGFTAKSVSTGEDTSEWAMQRMKEFYNYIPMVYPCVKLIAHFDRYIPGEANDFSIGDKPALAAEYKKLTKGTRFIQNRFGSKVLSSYKEVSDGFFSENILNLYTYVHIYGSEIASVSYYSDGVFLASSDKMPFNAAIDLSGFSNGDHSLKIIAAAKDGRTFERTIPISKYADNEPEISVTVNGAPVSFDQKPITYHSRTMVPMRTVFEALGSSVSWNGSEQSATGTKGTDTVTVSAGNSNIDKNGQTVSFDVPTFVLNDRTLVPVRAVAESFGCDVKWLENTHTVEITTN